MSKISIKFSITSQNDKQIFEGKAQKKDNSIIFYHDKIKTKINLNNQVTIEREGEYYLKLIFEDRIKKEGEYITKYGKLQIETFTKKLEIKENKLEIIYDLYIEKEYVDTFYYILTFSIDSI